MIVAACCGDESQGGGLVEEVTAHIQSLDATAQIDFVAEIVASVVEELKRDMGIAANPAEDRLLGDGDVTAQRKKDEIRLESHRGGVRAFLVVLEDQLHLKATQEDVAVHRDLRARGIVAES